MNRKKLIPFLVLVAFCLLLTPALAAAGTIEGKVTDESSSEPIEGLKVCAQMFGGAPRYCATSGAGGTYSITGLEAGSYKIEFNAVEAPEWSPALNYITEYYNNKATFEQAEKVSVGAESVTSGIDAVLAVGGQITGTVTDEATSEPIAGIKVCGFIIATDILSCDRTDATGFYDVLGLPTNSSYKVEFSATGTELEYATEYYNNKFSLFKATSVAVTAGAVTSGINAQLAP